MARFAFRLDPVLEHRKRLEDEQHIVMAAAMQRIHDAEWSRAEYVARRDEMRERIRSGHAAMDSDELRATYAHCEFLDRAIVMQDRVIGEARRLAEGERAILLDKTRDKKILETLKEHRRATFELEAAATEQRENDEINARRFDRAVAARETPS